MKTIINSVDVSDDRADYPAREKVKINWTDPETKESGTEVRYRHKEVPAINPDGTAFNGDRMPLWAAAAFLAGLALWGIGLGLEKLMELFF